MPVVITGKCILPLQNCRFHTHNTWEIILNLEGIGNDIVGETKYPFCPGSIICVPPNMPHSKVSNEQFKDIFILSTEFFLIDNPKVLCFQDDEEKSIETLMLMAYHTFHKQERNYLNIVDSLFDTIQHILLSRLKSPIRNKSIEKLIRLIVENFCDPEFEVSDAIAANPYCKDYIRRLFRKETGMSPVTYLNNLRLEHAKKLLKQQSVTGYSVGEIALMCGFYDPRYFTRLFKRYTAQSPMQYAVKSSN